MPLNEADTCRRYVVPKLQATGWETEPHRINEQVTFTDGRIIVAGRGGRRRPGKRAAEGAAPYRVKHAPANGS
jgi:type I restriction enzyme, R subunit